MIFRLKNYLICFLVTPVNDTEHRSSAPFDCCEGPVSRHHRRRHHGNTFHFTTQQNTQSVIGTTFASRHSLFVFRVLTPLSSCCLISFSFSSQSSVPFSSVNHNFNCIARGKSSSSSFFLHRHRSDSPVENTLINGRPVRWASNILSNRIFVHRKIRPTWRNSNRQWSRNISPIYGINAIANNNTKNRFCGVREWWMITNCIVKPNGPKRRRVQH